MKNVARTIVDELQRERGMNKGNSIQICITKIEYLLEKI